MKYCVDTRVKMKLQLNSTVTVVLNMEYALYCASKGQISSSSIK